MLWLAFVLAVIMAIALYISELYATHLRIHAWLTSLVSGVGISYVLMLLLPEIAAQTGNLGKLVFLLLLAGFTATHLIERHVYHHRGQRKIRKEQAHIHATFFVGYFFLIGMSLFFFSQIGTMSALLFFIPFTLYAVVKNLYPEQRWFHSRGVLALGSGAPVYGVLVAAITGLPELAFWAIMSFAAGAILYTIVREHFPAAGAGRPTFFLIGVVGYAAIILITEYLIKGAI